MISLKNLVPGQNKFRRSGPEEIEGAVLYEIVDSYRGLAKHLGDHVTSSAESGRLRELRVDAYAAHHPSGYRPYDVFSEPPFRPVDPDHMLKEVTLKRSAPKKLAEFSIVDRINVVSERVKQVIDSLEPGRHAFYPLRIHRSGDDEKSYQYYFLQFLERLSCVHFEYSGFEQRIGQGGHPYWRRETPDSKTFFREECVAGRHLFWDTDAKHGMVVSGVLAARLGNFLPKGTELVEAGLVRSKC